MTNLLEIVLIAAGMLLALLYFGYGATRVLLPPAFAAWRGLLTPFVGVALVIVWDYLALFVNLDLTRATWLLVGVVAILNGFVLLRLLREARASSPLSPFRAFIPTLSREHVIVSGLALVAFAAAVAPLVRYGVLTIIGENWDYEFYLPLADLLRGVASPMLTNVPPNPLLTTILSRHILPLPMGFTYLHASLDVLLGVEALDSFAILLGVLHGMSVIAAFVLFRATLKMSSRAALAAAALLASNGLLLWFTYWNFGLHLTALALLPLALMFGAHALGFGIQRNPVSVDPRHRVFLKNPVCNGFLFAGLFLGALNVTFHPALVAVLLPLGALGLYRLITHRPRRETIVRGAAMLALTLLFSFPTLRHIDDFLREYYGRTPLAIGLREYVPLSDGYGFSLRALELAVGHTIPTPWLYALVARVWDVSEIALTLIAVGLSLYALWQLRKDRERRAVWYIIVGASVFYIALFRLPFLRPYPYGFLKSLSLVSYVLIALATLGGEYVSLIFNPSSSLGTNFRFSIFDSRTLTSNLEPLTPKFSRFSLLASLPLALIALVTLLTFFLSIEQYFKPRPPFFDADALRVREAASVIPAGSTIFLTDRAEVQEIPMGLAAYALRAFPLHGKVKTGYGELDNAAVGKVYDYALLARGEPPSARGYQDQVLWENDTFALYPREYGVLASRTLNSERASVAPILYALDENRVAAEGALIDAPPVERAVAVAVVTFEPQTLQVTVGNTFMTARLDPGLSLVSVAREPLPAYLMLRPESAARLTIAYIQLREAGSIAQGVSASNAIVMDCGGAQAGLNAECRVVNPTRRSLTWKWIVRGTAAGTREERVGASAEVQGAPHSSVRFNIGNAGALEGIQFDGAPPLALTSEPLPVGKWRASVEVWDGAILLARFDVQRDITVNRSMGWQRKENAPVIIAP